MSSLILQDALCGVLAPPSLRQADLKITNGTLVEVAPNIPVGPADAVEHLRGALVMPGLVCAHTHLYSSLVRGMPGPEAEPADFTGILENIWWKLDKALDEETIAGSATAGALEAVRCGVTTIVDHHASPHAIRGSLSIIETALRRVGVRGILCYETSDRDGVGRRDQGLAENEEYLSSRRHHDFYRGLIGAHASFTLSDDSLRLLGAMAERHDAGVHVHVAEDAADPRMTASRFGRSIMDRFREFGLLRKRSVFAHCIHLHADDYAELRAAGPWLIHNPRSNMNNAVGHAPLHLFGGKSALGTDGFPMDLFEELRAAFFKDRESTPRVGPDGIIRLLQGGQGLVSEVFGRPFGGLTGGSPADLMVLDYAPPTPLTSGNFPYHFLFGLRSSMVRSVMVNGSWVMHDRKFLQLHEDEVLRDTARAAGRLWRKLHA